MVAVCCDDDVHYYIGERLKLEGETENMGVWTKKRGSMEAVVLMATPGPKSLHLQRGERRWVLLKRPRCDIDGVGEGKWP